MFTADDLIFYYRLSFAHDELQCCQTLLNNGYNFKPNSILNEDIIPEINDEFLKLKINGLRFAWWVWWDKCFRLLISDVSELLKAKEDNEDLKKCFKENWLKIGKLCETDFAKLSKNKKKGKEDDDEPPKEVVEEKKKKATGAIKKTEKQIVKKTEIGIQVTPAKGVAIGVSILYWC